MINLAQKTISELSLYENVVELYFISVEQWKKEYSNLWETLDSLEKAKANRFKFENDHLRYVIAHGVKRLVLSHLLNLGSNQLAFTHTENNKPCLKNKALHFNLSHSGAWVLLGVAQTIDIGVDIELMKPLASKEDIVERFFSKAEYQAYLALEPEEKLLGFYLVWTRKEAIVKAIGKGISFGLDQFEVNLEPNEPAKLARMYHKDWQKKWFLEGGLFMPDYIYAIAWHDDVNARLLKKAIIV